MEYTHIKTENDLHVFHDADGNIYKVGASVGTVGDAIRLLNTPPKVVEPTYKELREKAYIEQGLTPEYFAMCLIQKELDSDTKMLDEYKAKRQAIKLLYPKTK